MTWIGLKERHQQALFDPCGIGAPLSKATPVPAGPKPTPDSPLSTGTLLVEFEIEPADTRQNLLRYSAREPWHSSLTLCIDPDNSLRLMMGQSEGSFTAVLPLPLGQARQRVIVSFVWDGPTRQAVIAARLPDIGHTTMAEVRNPLPLCYRDVQRILASPSHCKIGAEVVFAAVSTACEPIGTTATLGGGTMVDTPGGPRQISRLRPGDFVDTIDGEPAQLRWIGYQDLPARGSFAPHLVRSPYYGLTRDLLIAPDQNLRLSGSGIEYTFGQESVFASVRHLDDGVSILTPPGFVIVRYWQMLLDRHTVIRCSGGELESLDSAPFLADPDQRRHSILRALPLELIPRGRRLLMPSLRAFEAVRIAR